MPEADRHEFADREATLIVAECDSETRALDGQIGDALCLLDIPNADAAIW